MDESFSIPKGTIRDYPEHENRRLMIDYSLFNHLLDIHISGDEAHFDGMAEDPETIAYMAKHNIPKADELFRHFIIKMNEIVKQKGKQTLAWAGFSRLVKIKNATT